MKYSQPVDKMIICLLTFFLLMLFPFMMSCVSLTPIHTRTFSDTELSPSLTRANPNRLLTSKAISLLVIKENSHHYHYISIDGEEIKSDNITEHRQWTVELLPGQHTIKFGVDVMLDKKMNVRWSIKSKTCSFVAEPGHVYELAANRIRIFSWDQLVTDITEEYYKEHKLVYRT